MYIGYYLYRFFLSTCVFSHKIVNIINMVIVNKQTYRKKKSLHKISLVKNFVTSKIIRHFLPTNFFCLAI